MRLRCYNLNIDWMYRYHELINAYSQPFLDPYSRDGLWSLQEVFNYYKRNLNRFTNLISNHDLDSIFRPGKYSPQASNNIEKILQYADTKFQPTLNATSAK